MLRGCQLQKLSNYTLPFHLYNTYPYLNISTQHCPQCKSLRPISEFLSKTGARTVQTCRRYQNKQAVVYLKPHPNSHFTFSFMAYCSFLIQSRDARPGLAERDPSSLNIPLNPRPRKRRRETSPPALTHLANTQDSPMTKRLRQDTVQIQRENRVRVRVRASDRGSSIPLPVMRPQCREAPPEGVNRGPQCFICSTCNWPRPWSVATDPQENLQCRYYSPAGGIRFGETMRRFCPGLNCNYTGPVTDFQDNSGRETVYCN